MFEKHQLQLENWQVNALSFWPQRLNEAKVGAIFTHGYTAHKGDLITWAIKLSEIGIPTILFDLPGHYLGSYNEVGSLDQFQQNAHKLFAQAYQLLHPITQKVVLGGHSLGGLLALQAFDLPELKQLEKVFIAVGLGVKSTNEPKSLASPFMDQFLQQRAGLVSPQLISEAIFPWIQNSKRNLAITNQVIHLITGQDDYVVSSTGSENLMAQLQQKGNQATLNKPPRLAHNRPELAAIHIKKFLKNFVT